MITHSKQPPDEAVIHSASPLTARRAAPAFLSALSAWFLIEGKDLKKTKSEDKQ